MIIKHQEVSAEAQAFVRVITTLMSDGTLSNKPPCEWLEEMCIHHVMNNDCFKEWTVAETKIFIDEVIEMVPTK